MCWGEFTVRQGAQRNEDGTGQEVLFGYAHLLTPPEFGLGGGTV